MISRACNSLTNNFHTEVFCTVGSDVASKSDPEALVKSKPLKAMKMKRDPKKLRMGGGKVWEDHTLDDWDQGKSNSCFLPMS